MPLADCSVVNPFSNQILLVLSLINSVYSLRTLVCSECMPVDSTQMTGDPSGGNMWWRFHIVIMCAHCALWRLSQTFHKVEEHWEYQKKKKRKLGMNLRSTSSCSENHDASPYYVCRSFFWGCFKVNILSILLFVPVGRNIVVWTCKLLLEGFCFLLNTSERIWFSPSASDSPIVPYY